MEAAVLTPPPKNGKISLRFGEWEVRHFQPRRMTDEEFYAFCRENPELKIEQDKYGNVIVMPPVSPDSASSELEVGTDLTVWNRKTRLGKTFSSSVMFTLPDGSKRMPDASWISSEKYDRLSERERQSFAKIVPDFVIEVRSPSDSLTELKEKMTDAWIANGVRLAWLLDPESQSVWVYRADGSTETLAGFDKKLSGEDVLPGFEFDLSVLKD
ncbi:MAG: Uma2 family endonuclease [Saprospiraceae bacterium]|nr:Uma2 family endonuclease [Saprospiraceae bacterium]